VPDGAVAANAVGYEPTDMSAESALVEQLLDVLRPLGGVAARRMFGGAGLFRDGVMFALISDEVLYLKADATTVPAFEAEDLGPFTYGTKNGDRVLTSYWRTPERLLDDDEDMRDWCRRAAEVAVQASKKSSKRSAVNRTPAAARSHRSRARRDG
jgi:DNA transformation protein and related proteins